MMGMTDDALPPDFRRWSIFAFALESLAVILFFLFMVLVLRWQIDMTMIAMLFVFIVISAVLLILTGKTVAGK